MMVLKPHYNMPRRVDYNENLYQEFIFSPTLTFDPTTVLIRINHRTTQTPTNVKIEVWEQSTSTWHNEPITPTSTTWVLDEVNVSTYIDTQDDINNLKVRYLSYVNGNNKDANIDYITIYVE